MARDKPFEEEGIISPGRGKELYAPRVEQSSEVVKGGTEVVRWFVLPALVLRKMEVLDCC